MSNSLPEWCLEALRHIGLQTPDPSNPFHVALVNSVMRLGAGRSMGEYLTALRFVISWDLEEAGRVFAEAKAAYEHKVDREMVTIAANAQAAGERVPVALMEKMARLAAQEEHTRFLVAEQRERHRRKLLDACGSAVEVWRTRRADSRATDVAYVQGFAGGA